MSGCYRVAVEVVAAVVVVPDFDRSKNSGYMLNYKQCNMKIISLTPVESFAIPVPAS